jgi:hypothetical protein
MGGGIVKVELDKSNKAGLRLSLILIKHWVDPPEIGVTVQGKDPADRDWVAMVVQVEPLLEENSIFTLANPAPVQLMVWMVFPNQITFVFGALTVMFWAFR